MSQKAKARTKITGEVFTPTKLVDEMLDKLPIEVFTDPTKTFIDPACGNGQFIVPVIDKKIANGVALQEALSTTYGVDLMVDNVCDTICRLYILANSWDDPFNEKGHNSDLLTVSHAGHNVDEHPTFDWLTSEYYREYHYGENKIPIRIEFAEYTSDKKIGAYFKCNGVLWHTIVCADSLKFLSGEENDFKEHMYNIDEMLYDNIINLDKVTVVKTNNEEPKQKTTMWKESFDTFITDFTALQSENEKLKRQVVKSQQEKQQLVEEQQTINGTIQKLQSKLRDIQQILTGE